MKIDLIVLVILIAFGLYGGFYIYSFTKSHMSGGKRIKYLKESYSKRR